MQKAAGNNPEITGGIQQNEGNMKLNGMEIYKEGSLTHEAFRMYWHMSGCAHYATEKVMELYRQMVVWGKPAHTLN